MSVSLMSLLQRAVTPKAPPRREPQTMHIGGLQLECPVCCYDLFHRRQLVVQDPYRSTNRMEVQGFVGLSAIACDRCGAVQLFDPTARRDPEAPIPARRAGRLRRRQAVPGPDQADVEVEDGDDGDGGDGGDDGIEDESAGLLPDEAVDEPLASVDLDAGEEQGEDEDRLLRAAADQGASVDAVTPAGAGAPGAGPALAPPPPSGAPAEDGGPVTAGWGASWTPLWPDLLPPLPPLPPIEQEVQEVTDPAARPDG